MLHELLGALLVLERIANGEGDQYTAQEFLEGRTTAPAPPKEPSERG